MGPLTGLRILEIQGLGPAPYAGMLLADLGADVLVVERPADAVSMSLPPEHDLFLRGKRRLKLDLKAPSDLAVLLQLVERSHALIEGFRPGVAERLGFGPDTCLAKNPGLVYGRMTGWGQEGPLADKAGHDLNYIGLTGALAAMGSEEQPMVPLNLLGDFAGGSLFLVVGLLAALHEQQRSGQGQVVDAAIVDGTTHLMTLFHTFSRLGLWQPQRASNLLDGGAPFYRVYPTRDGEFMAVGALEPKFFARVVETLGLPERFLSTQHEKSAWPEMTRCFEEAFVAKTRDEWVAAFDSVDACVTPVLSSEEAPEHAHNTARSSRLEVEGVSQSGIAPRFSRSASACPEPVPPEPIDSKTALAAWSENQT